MGRTPELGIKVRVDPVVDGAALKRSINTEVDKLNNTGDAEKIKIEVDVDHFQNSLNTQLKDELKRVNKDLKYYLSNLTENASKLDDVVVNLFGNADFSKKISDQFSEVSKTLDIFKNELFNTNKIYEAAFKNIDFNSLDKFKALLNEFKTEFEDLTDVDKSGILDNAEELVPQFNKLVEKARVLESGLKGLTSIKGRPDLLKTLGFSSNEYTALTKYLDSLKNTLTSLSDIKTSGDFVKNSVDVVDLARDVNDNFLVQQFDDVENFLNKLDDVIQKRNEFFKELQAKEFAPPKEVHNKSDIESTAKRYSDVLSALVSQQNALNVAKQTTIGIEDQLITKTQSVRNAVNEELKYLRDFLKDVDTGILQTKVDDVEKLADKVKVAIREIDQSTRVRTNGKQQVDFPSAKPKESEKGDIIKYETALSAIDGKITSAQQKISDFKVFLEQHQGDFKDITADVNAYTTALGEIDYSKIKESMSVKDVVGNNKSKDNTQSQVSNILGKVELTVEDIIPPKTPVSIPGKVVLTKNDVVSPSNPINLNGKIVIAKEDIITPLEPIDLKGKLTLSKEDIESPPVLVDVKVPASEDEVKQQPTINFDDQKILESLQNIKNCLDSIGNVLNEQKKTLTQIATSAQKRENFSTGSIKKSTDFDELKQLYDDVAKFEKKRGLLFKDSDVAALKAVDTQLSATRKKIDLLEQSMQKAGKNPLDSQLVSKAKHNAEFEVQNSAIDFKNNRIEYIKDSYIATLRELSKAQESLLTTTDKNVERALKQNIDKSLKYLETARAELLSYNADANNAWKEIESVKSKLSISEAEAIAASIKKEEIQEAKKLSQQQKLIGSIEKKISQKLSAYKKLIYSSPEKKELYKYNYEAVSDELGNLFKEANSDGLSNDKRIQDALKKYALEKKTIISTYKKVIDDAKATLGPTQNEIIALIQKVGQYKTYLDRLVSTHKNDDRIRSAKEEYDRLNDLVDTIANAQRDESTDKNNLVAEWAKKENIEDVYSLADAISYITRKVVEFRNESADLKNADVLTQSVIRGRTMATELASNIERYLQKNKRIEESKLGPQFRDLISQLSTDEGWKNYSSIKESLAGLKKLAYDAGLETETLSEKFEKLFGEHLSTALVMGALHQLQQSLQIMFQNVVNINTAMTELRKVSNMTVKEMADYMEEAADRAAQLGVSITSYVSSTADWKRLGYTDSEAKNLATYSTLLKNVGDGIEDVNTASSYLITTLQGFHFDASQAEEVVDILNQVANTQPVTAVDLGEILTRSSAAMSAAGNTLEETLALGAAANAVIQNADVVGTTLKTLSMYLRASKVELEASGESAEGCAESVAELRSELKALTGVDIMKSNDEFKSTYQILKELSEVWNGLSDIKQASVTELIAGKRNANAVSAILEGFDIAESTLKSATESAGNAWKENEVYLDSIQGKLNQVSAAFESLSYHAIDSEPVKFLLSVATTIIKLTDGAVKLTGALPAATGALSAFLSAMQATGKLKDGAGKVNMPSYTHCLIEYRMQHLKYTPRLLGTPKALSLKAA